jgi:hypothetical protein
MFHLIIDTMDFQNFYYFKWGAVISISMYINNIETALYLYPLNVSNSVKYYIATVFHLDLH